MAGNFKSAPGAWPIVGHAPGLHVNAVERLRSWRSDLGPVFWVDLGLGFRRLFCLDAAGLAVLRDPRFDVAYGVFSNLAAGAVMSVDGPEHRRLRSALNAVFSRSGIARGAAETMASGIERSVQRWVRVGRIDAAPETDRVAFESLFRVMGIPDDELPAWLTRCDDFVKGLIPISWEIPGFPRYAAGRARKWLVDRLGERVAAARAGLIPDALLARMTQTVDFARRPLSDQDVVLNAMAFGAADHGTTGAVLAWSLVELARRPELQRRLRDEARGTTPPVTPESLACFPVAEAIFREAARRYSPTWSLMRVATTDADVGGVTVPSGTFVCVSPAYACRDAAVFPDPDRFDVDRWIGSPKAPTHAELAAFGSGAHFCLGYVLAVWEGVQLLSAVGRSLDASDLSMRLVGSPPKLRYYPLAHPTSAKIAFEPSKSSTV